MANETIVKNSPVGKHLENVEKNKPASYLVFNKKKVELVAKIRIGRDSDNDVIIDNKLASRHHALIQKIKDAYFIKDEESTEFPGWVEISKEEYIKKLTEQAKQEIEIALNQMSHYRKKPNPNKRPIINVFM